MPLLNLEHLLDPDRNVVPDLPVPGELPERPDVLRAGGGMRINQIDDEAVLSTRPGEESSGGGDTVYIDPLASVSFRLSLSIVGEDRFINVVKSYVNNIYYESGWVHEHFEIAAESLPITEFPQFIYLKMPVRFVTGTGSISSDFPISPFSSEPQTINGVSTYIFSLINTTGYITRNRMVTPANYFILSPLAFPVDDMTVNPDGSATGFWHFRLGDIAEGQLQPTQTHIGSLTLPAPMTYNVIDFNVTS